MGEPAGCPGAPVGGHQARNTDRRARGNSVRPSGRGPQRSGLWTGSYPKDRRRHEQPAPTLPPARPHARTPARPHARTPARPHQRQLRRGSDPTRRDPHRGHFHARATIPRMRWLVGILWGQTACTTAANVAPSVSGGRGKANPGHSVASRPRVPSCPDEADRGSRPGERAHRHATRGRTPSASRSCPCHEKRWMSRSNPRRNPPARGRRAGRRPGAGRAMFTPDRGTTMSFRSRAAPRRSPGIMRGGDLCRCSRCTISCAVL